MIPVGLFGRSVAHLVSEPGIEVHREVRSLLLRASRGDDGQPALAGRVADFLVCEVAVFHVWASPATCPMNSTLSASRDFKSIRWN